MTIVDFITGLAWVWGVLCVISIFISFCPPHRDSDPVNLAYSVFLGVLPWAWLIARYMVHR